MAFFERAFCGSTAGCGERWRWMAREWRRWGQVADFTVQWIICHGSPQYARFAPASSGLCGCGYSGYARMLGVKETFYVVTTEILLNRLHLFLKGLDIPLHSRNGGMRSTRFQRGYIHIPASSPVSMYTKTLLLARPSGPPCCHRYPPALSSFRLLLPRRATQNCSLNHRTLSRPAPNPRRLLAFPAANFHPRCTVYAGVDRKESYRPRARCRGSLTVSPAAVGVGREVCPSHGVQILA